jgi:hypothetical protein
MSIDAISAAGRYIPSFLILSVKALLEDYALADVDDDVVITHTDSGYNNAHRALQWLKHFNSHSFKASDSFKGHTIESWFGYAADISYKDKQGALLYSNHTTGHKAAANGWILSPRRPRIPLVLRYV